MKRQMTRTVLAALLVLATAGHAADDETPREDQPRTEQQSAADKSQAKRSHARMNELDHCKEKAHGMKGPERARYMTECLRSDRYEK